MTYIPIKDLKDEVQNSNIYLNQMADVIAQARGVVGDMRVTVVGGNVNVTGSLAAVTNLSQIATVSAATTVYDIMNTSAVLTNVNNFTI